MPDTALVGVVVDILRKTAPTIGGGLDNHDKSLFDAGIDSLDHAALLLALEEKYAIKIPDSDVDGLSSINQIATYLERRLAA
jgi:acyl carrier protein